VFAFEGVQLNLLVLVFADIGDFAARFLIVTTQPASMAPLP
jgi:hypothetical protein